MTSSSSPQQRPQLNAAEELESAMQRAGATLRRKVPLWVVSADHHVDVRTWWPRPNGWFGRIVHSLRARIQVPEVQADVTITDVSAGAVDPRRHRQRLPHEIRRLRPRHHRADGGRLRRSDHLAARAEVTSRPLCYSSQQVRHASACGDMKRKIDVTTMVSSHVIKEMVK
jgi:Uncharacterized protein conserved in bacteria (DUF2255)